MITPVVPYNPVLLLLFNTSTERWHPILFWECPPPSGDFGDCQRWKSKAHHTDGFETRAEAVGDPQSGLMALCKRQHDSKVGGEVYYDTDHPMYWDGKEIPAMVMRFLLDDLAKYVPQNEQNVETAKTAEG